MKTRLTLSAALLLGLALGGCTKEDPQGFPKVDYNKDGRIIFEELIVVFPDLTVEEFLVADADKSGVLNEQEYQRFHQARLAGKKLDPASAPPAPAAPAKPANTPEPAKPAAPAPAPTEAAPAAPPAAPSATPPPAAPASPMAPASKDATSAGPEAVETVEVGPAAPAAPGAGTAQTYTVVRGDSLARIAKKYDVSQQALMAANGLKNADQLQAGATLTIPPAGGGAAPAPAPVAVTGFVAGVFAKNASGDVNGLLDAYGETVDYYKKGKSGKDVVRQDKADYFGRWPERTYTPGAASVETLQNGDLRVTVPTAFTAKKGDKGVTGKATFTFVLRPVGDSFRIVGEQSVVTEKK